MKMKSFLLILCAMLFSTTLLADECTNTCESDYADCKKVAENSTQKQACETDAKECKAACNKPL